MISRWFNMLVIVLVIALALLLSAPLQAAWQSAVNGRMLGKRMPPLAVALDAAVHGVERRALADGAGADAGTGTDTDAAVILVDFWAPSCAPCRERVPLLNRLQQTYGARGLTVIGMAREPPAELASFVQRVPMKYPVRWDRDGSLFARMGMRSLPYAVLVDRNGIIVWQGDPSDLSDATIATTLAAPSLGALVRL